MTGATPPPSPPPILSVCREAILNFTVLPPPYSQPCQISLTNCRHIHEGGEVGREGGVGYVNFPQVSPHRAFFYLLFFFRYVVLPIL